jgi:hypothetical protein
MMVRVVPEVLNPGKWSSSHFVTWTGKERASIYFMRSYRTQCIIHYSIASSQYILHVHGLRWSPLSTHSLWEIITHSHLVRHESDMFKLPIGAIYFYRVYVMRVRFLLPTTVLTASFVGSHWKKSHECEGFPNSIHVFAVADPESCDQPVDEAWPPFYTAYCPAYPYDFCGNLHGDMLPKQCCVDSLDLAISDGYESGVMAEAVDPTSILSFASSKANGGLYCHLHAQATTDLFGYRDVYVLNDGSCNESIRFHSNLTMELYSEKDCSGTITLSECAPISRQLQVPLHGNITVRSVVFDKGTVETGWIMPLPTALLVPAFRYGWEFIALIGFVVSTVCFTYCVYYAFLKYKKNQTWTTRWMILSNVLLLLWISLRIAYVYTVFPDFDSVRATSRAEKTTLNIATLTVAFYTSSFLSGVTKLQWIWKIGMNALIVFCHFLFAGQVYLSIFMETDLGSFMDAWSYYVFYWFLFLFVFDLVPILVIVWRITEGYNQRATLLWTNGRYVVIGLLLQIVNTLTYYVLVYVKDYTSILGSDYIYIAFACLRATILAIHSLLNTFLIEQVRCLIDSFKNSIGTLGTQSIASTTKYVSTKTVKTNI